MCIRDSDDNDDGGGNGGGLCCVCLCLSSVACDCVCPCRSLCCSASSLSFSFRIRLASHSAATTQRQQQGCRVRVKSSRSPGFGLESESPLWHTLHLNCTWSLLLCGFVQCTVLAGLKFCKYTIVHLLSEKFRISLKSLSTGTQSVCQTPGPRVGVGVPQSIRTPHSATTTTM